MDPLDDHLAILCAAKLAFLDYMRHVPRWKEIELGPTNGETISHGPRTICRGGELYAIESPSRITYNLAASNSQSSSARACQIFHLSQLYSNNSLDNFPCLIPKLLSFYILVLELEILTN